jgi:putative FmdB family regulatory protein
MSLLLLAKVRIALRPFVEYKQTHPELAPALQEQAGLSSSAFLRQGRSEMDEPPGLGKSRRLVDKRGAFNARAGGPRHDGSICFFLFGLRQGGREGQMRVTTFERRILWNTSAEADMPTYEYLCRACHKTFSKTLTLAEADKQKVVCPHCRSAKVEQRPSAFYAVTSRKSA